jgi:proline iminopeptidase
LHVDSSTQRLIPHQGHVLSGRTSLYYRELGNGPPVVVLHGGPDFDHNYFLPELDRLAESFRIIYYDQRGRGRSADGVRPEDVTIRSEMEDLEQLRRHFQLESVAILGHSWGGVLAMEYATRHPDRVSHLILLDTAPASHDDSLLLREHFRRLRPPSDAERMQTLSSSDLYQQGDFDVEAEYYRIHFGLTLHDRQQLEQVVERLRTHFTQESVLIARAIEHRLYDETWLSADYDLLPKLRSLAIPTLVLHGEEDFIPIELAAHIAEAIPGALLSVLPGCGHFAYLQQPDLVAERITAFLSSN